MIDCHVLLHRQTQRHHRFLFTASVLPKLFCRESVVTIGDTRLILPSRNNPKMSGIFIYTFQMLGTWLLEKHSAKQRYQYLTKFWVFFYYKVRFAFTFSVKKIILEKLSTSVGIYSVFAFIRKTRLIHTTGCLNGIPRPSWVKSGRLIRKDSAFTLQTESAWNIKKIIKHLEINPKPLNLGK